MRGFAEHAVRAGDGYLMLVGPEVSGVTDDPEGAGVPRRLPGAVAEPARGDPGARGYCWSRCRSTTSRRTAAMINAIQRHAAVIVQKSLAEGFGLTVAEGMWESRPAAWLGRWPGSWTRSLKGHRASSPALPADLAVFGSEVRWPAGPPGRGQSRMGRAAP